MKDCFDLGPSWNAALKSELSAPYMSELRTFLESEEREKIPYYPTRGLIFNAFRKTPLEKVRVVIVGQDPYHGHGQAHGLSFSVPEGVKPPPSLKNVLKEVSRDIGEMNVSHGSLERWAEQGVLLLNAVLTVRAGEPLSHKNKGWERFTDAVLAKLNERQKPLVFLLWGKYAQKKGAFLDPKRHLILHSAHPSPYSAAHFHGNGHFSSANKFLVKCGEKPICWNQI